MIRLLILLILLPSTVFCAEITVYWVGVPGATAYRIYYGDKSRCELIQYRNYEDSTTTLHKLNLQGYYGEIFIAVTSRNVYGESYFSNEVSALVPCDESDLNASGAIDGSDLALFPGHSVNLAEFASQFGKISQCQPLSERPKVQNGIPNSPFVMGIQ